MFDFQDPLVSNRFAFTRKINHFPDFGFAAIESNYLYNSHPFIWPGKDNDSSDEIISSIIDETYFHHDIM